MSITVHGLFFALGGLLTVGLYYRLTVPLKPKLSEALFDLAAIFFAGLLGARLGYWLMHPNLTIGEGFSFWHSGLVSYGGLLGGLLLALLLWRHRHGPARLDALALALLFGWAVGRIGNFGYGDAYGQLHPSFGPLFYYRVPVVLYELFGLLLLAGGALLLRRHEPRAGWLLWYALTGYGLLRLLIDGWRELPDILVGLNISQLVAIALALCGMIGLLLWRKQHLTTSQRRLFRNSANSSKRR